MSEPISFNKFQFWTSCQICIQSNCIKENGLTKLHWSLNKCFNKRSLKMFNSSLRHCPRLTPIIRELHGSTDGFPPLLPRDPLLDALPETNHLETKLLGVANSHNRSKCIYRSSSNLKPKAKKTCYQIAQENSSQSSDLTRYNKKSPKDLQFSFSEYLKIFTKNQRSHGYDPRIDE